MTESAPKKRGRKPHHGVAKTRAEIQRDYRQRRALATVVDFDLLSAMSRVNLVDALTQALASIDTCNDEDLRQGAEFTAEKGYPGTLKVKATYSLKKTLQPRFKPTGGPRWTSTGEQPPALAAHLHDHSVFEADGSRLGGGA